MLSRRAPWVPTSASWALWLTMAGQACLVEAQRLQRVVRVGPGLVASQRLVHHTGKTLASFAVAPNAGNQGVSFGLTAGLGASLSKGGVLGLTLNGATGWDMTIDTFDFSFDVPTANVPEPAALALVGLAPLGVCAASRRRRA